MRNRSEIRLMKDTTTIRCIELVGRGPDEPASAFAAIGDAIGGVWHYGTADRPLTAVDRDEALRQLLRSFPLEAPEGIETVFLWAPKVVEPRPAFTSETWAYFRDQLATSLGEIRLVVYGDPDNDDLSYFPRVDLIGVVVAAAVVTWPTADLENWRFRPHNMPLNRDT